MDDTFNVTERELHPLAHTALMLATLADRPDHHRADEYRKVMGDYAHQWAGYTPEQRAAIVRVASSPEYGGQLTHMAPEPLAAAVAALEDITNGRR